MIGIAGGEKTEYVVEELGFDACIDRKTANIGEQLDELCPKGVDVYFDNVGGSITRAVFDRMADFGRVVVCGMISEYNQDESEVGPPPLRPVLRKRLRIEGSSATTTTTGTRSTGRGRPLESPKVDCATATMSPRASKMPQRP